MYTLNLLLPGSAVCKTNPINHGQQSNLYEEITVEYTSVFCKTRNSLLVGEGNLMAVHDSLSRVEATTRALGYPVEQPAQQHHGRLLSSSR